MTDLPRVRRREWTMVDRRGIALARLRGSLPRWRGTVLALAATVSFYSLGGQEALHAAELTQQKAEEERRATLQALGVPPEQLSAPQPMPLAAAVERVAGRLDRGVRAAGAWAVARGEQLARPVHETYAALSAAGSSSAPERLGPSSRPATVPQPGSRIRLAAEPELESEVPARGAVRRKLLASKSLGAGEGGMVALQRVERRARRQDVGALVPTLEASSALAPAPLQAVRIAGNSAPAPEIVALAQSLGNSPGRIFRYVHDSVAYDPVWGADASPLGTLWEGRGSAWEQAWLLQELLLAAGVDARLEWGTIEISPAMLQDLTGVADVFRAGDLLTTAGNDIVLLVQGGQVVAAQLPHAWVKANLDYVPNRGATAGAGDTWIRMDPTLERFDEAYGHRVDEAVPFALGNYLTSGTESSPRASYEASLSQYAIDQNLGIASLEELKPRRAVHVEAFPYVPGTLRVKIVAVAGESATMPASAQQTLLLEVIGRDGASLLSWTVAWPSVWGQRVELAWPGATASDQSTLELYGGIFATPPSEVTLRPSIVVDGVQASLGSPVGSAQDVELRATITPPHGVRTFASWPMFAGEHGVVQLSFGHLPQQVVDLFAQRQAAATTPAESEGWGLARAAATYLHALGEDFEHLGALRWHRMLILGSAVLAVQRGAVSTASDGTPLTFEQGPLAVDVGAMPLGLFPAEGAQVSTVATLELVGSQGSVREGEALAAAFGGEHVTAVGFLTRAVRAGQTLTRVEATNLDAALAEAELSADAEAQIRFAVGQGLIAWISRTQLLINGFQTTGYVLENPSSGAGAYLVTFERRVVLGQSAVTIHAPADLTVVTEPTDVVASIAADALATWTLATRPVGEVEATVLASGTGPVDHAVVGRLDPTLLLNGMHDVVLTGTTAGGQTVTGRITVAVEGGMKIGNFTLSFVDLTVPLSGLAIEVVRTYDSRARGTSGDFGHGWWVEVRQGSYRHNRRPGEGWQILKGLLPCQLAAETKSHLTTIRLSDREVYRFRPTLSRPALTGGGCFAQAGFAFVEGPVPGARLEVLGTTEVFWQNGTTQVVDPNTFETYEPRQVRMTTRDGRVFDLDAGQGVTRLADANGNALTIGAGGVTHSAGESITFRRDGEGRITAITDPSGASLVYAYAGGDLASVTDRAGATTRFGYLAGHFLETIEDPLGRTPIRNEYGPDGRLTRHIDVFGNEIAYDHRLSDRQEVVTNRLGASRLLEYDARGNVTREVDESGVVTVRTFDADDQLLSESVGGLPPSVHVYDAARNLTETRDGLGNSTRFTYDARGNVLTTTDPRGGVTSNTYDTRGNLLQTVDALGGTSEFTYDGGGNLLSESDALGHASSFAYDGRGNLTRETDALGHAATFTYDSRGNRLSETRTRTRADGSVETLTTQYAYDANGQLVSTTAPDASLTRSEFNALGQVTASVDALGRRTVLIYDALGRQTRTEHPDGTFEESGYDAENRRVSSTDRAGRLSAYEYDPAGRLRTTTLPGGAVLEQVYDSVGRLAQAIDPLGHATASGYDAAGRRLSVTNALGEVTTFAYDAAGNQVAVTDARGGTTAFVYDAAGRLIRTIAPDATDRATGYDALGRRVTETDEAGRITRFGYDALGRLVSVTDALNQVTTYAYDEAGNRISQSDANGHVTRFEVDSVGRQTKRILPDGAEERFSYDAAGNRTSRTDFLGRTTLYDYDAQSRLLRRTYPGNVAVSFTYSPTGRRLSATDARGTTTYGYDSRDRVTSLSYPDGRSLAYAYDAAGNRTSLTANVAGQALTALYTYDALNRLETVTDPAAKVYVHAYDANGNRASLLHPNGVATTYGYDASNRLTNLTAAHAVSGVITSFAYTLGPTGSRTRITEHDGTTKSYTYDALSRLTDETVTQGSTPGSPTRWRNTFTYDPVGNRLHQDKTTGAGAPLPLAYTYDTRDRLLTENELAYTWDANGNQTSKSGPDGAVYTWDEENRLTRVALANGSVVEHTYDADGTRVRTRTTPATGPPATVDYLVDPWHQTSAAGRGLVLSQVVAETDETGSLTAYHVRGDDLLATLRPNTAPPGPGVEPWVARYFHADGLGSIRALTDEAGVVADRYSLEAFGTLLSHEGEDANQYLFAGEPLDPNSGFYYNRARWLDPNAGRFASLDHLAGFPSEPSSLHKYLYAGARPSDSIDPAGLSEFSLGGQLANIAIRASLSAQSAFAALRIAFAQGDGGAIGRLFRELGLRAQGFAGEVLSLFPRLNVQTGQRGVQVGRQFIDFLLRAANRVAYMEVKYALPRNWGTSLDRLVRQVNESLVAIAELPAGLQGQAVVWTYAEPTLRQLRLIQTALGPNVSRVQFINGLDGLYRWVTLYFHGLL